MIPPKLVEKLSPTLKGGTVSVSLGSVLLVAGWLWWGDRADLLARLDAIEMRAVECACLTDSDLLQLAAEESATDESTMASSPAGGKAGKAASRGRPSDR